MNATHIHIFVRYVALLDWVHFADCFEQHNPEMHNRFCEEQAASNKDFIPWMAPFIPQYCDMVHKTSGSINQTSVSSGRIVNEFIFESNEEAIQFKLRYSDFIEEK